MAIVHLSKENFNSEVQSGFTFVDFWAEWCTPCKMIAPIIEDIAKEMDGKVKIGKLDTDKDPEIAGLYGIQGIPTLILFKDGKPVDRITGAANKMIYMDFLNRNLDK